MAYTKNAKLWQWATLSSSSLVLILWVLFRFSTKSVNFDLVGQQLLSRQWMEGNLDGSLVGPTNYILKMFFLYMPAELLGIDPKLSLLCITIALNIATLIGMYFVVRKILEYFSVEIGGVFHLSVLWLSTVAGSVFWVQFTNSRNLELLAGLVLLYIGLLLYRNLSFHSGALFFVVGGITYFSDPLQLFVTTTVLVSYVFLNSFLIEKDKRREPFCILLLVAGSYSLSRLLLLAVRHFTGVEFVTMDTLSNSMAVFDNIPLTVIETAKNTLRLLAGTNEMGIWRQVATIALVGCMASLSVFSLIKNKLYGKYRSFVLFVMLLLAVPIAVYVASGQAVFRGDTSRYLIVLAPALIILFSVSDIKNLPVKVERVAAVAMAAVLPLTIGTLLYATITRSGTILDTAHLEPRYAYLEKEGYSYGYASMDTAIPSMYFFGKKGDGTLLPLSCDGTTLRKSTLFYDKNIFIKNEAQGGVVPIVLDGNSISNYPNDCTVERIEAQIGRPLSIGTSGGDTVLLYDASQLQALHF